MPSAIDFGSRDSTSVHFVIVSESPATPLPNSFMIKPQLKSWLANAMRRIRLPESERYSWIFEPPGTPEWVKQSYRQPDDLNAKDGNDNDTVKAMSNVLSTGGLWRARLDLPRLIIQWLMVAFVVAALVATSGDRDTPGSKGAIVEGDGEGIEFER